MILVGEVRSHESVDDRENNVPCCMEEHDIQRIAIVESNEFKDVPVQYNAESFYCDRAGERYANEQQISLNYIAFKNAYREKMGL